jgi:hypothetical protein
MQFEFKLHGVHHTWLLIAQLSPMQRSAHTSMAATSAFKRASA